MTIDSPLYNSYTPSKSSPTRPVASSDTLQEHFQVGLRLHSKTFYPPFIDGIMSILAILFIFV